jgi:hypothetical protein
MAIKVSWMNFWMHRFHEVRGKQGQQQRGSRIDVVCFDCGGPGRCYFGGELNGAKPALAGPADRRHRTLRLRRSNQQEDGVEHGAGLDQTGKSPALPGRSVERQGACRLPELVLKQPADMRQAIKQPGEIGAVGQSSGVGIVHGQIVRTSAEPTPLS